MDPASMDKQFAGYFALQTVASQPGRATIDKLSKLSGSSFDKAYIAQMMKDHKNDVSKFEKESKSGKTRTRNHGQLKRCLPSRPSRNGGRHC